MSAILVYFSNLYTAVAVSIRTH